MESKRRIDRKSKIIFKYCVNRTQEAAQHVNSRYIFGYDC
jgi:hypothetical protein